MPAKSEAQRRYLNMKFGHAWVIRHGFDNEGKLPEHARKHGYKNKHHYDIAQRALRKV